MTGQKKINVSICLHNELQRSLKYNVYMIIFLDHYLYKLILPRKAGVKDLVVSFNSKELAMVDASCEITISA